jgi:hypothetical protein
MSSVTRTASATYTTVDVENVVRRLKADLMMIADSTGAWTSTEAANYSHDIELLARKGYLSSVDVTLLSYGSEVTAVCYDVDEDAGSLTASRPGGVLWPRVAGARLRIVIRHTAAYDAAAERDLGGKLKINWTSTTEDISHSALSGDGGRNYTSNAYGMKRKDWKK